MVVGRLLGEPGSRERQESGEGCGGELPVGDALAKLPRGEWMRVGVPLECLRAAGVDTGKLDVPFALRMGSGARIALARVAVGDGFEHEVGCAAR